MVSGDVFAGLFSSNSDDVKTLEKGASSFKDLYKLMSDLSTSLDSFNEKNYMKISDPVTLMALRLLTKNLAEVCKWLNLLLTYAKTNLKDLEDAEKTLEKSNEKGRDKAELKKNTALKNIQVAYQILTINGLNVVLANAKASTSLFLQTIKKINITDGKIDSLKKEAKNLASKCGTASGQLNTICSVSETLVKTANMTVDIEELKKDVKLSIDVMEKIHEYIDSGKISDNDSDDLIQRSAL
jgi:hypothetical protein